MMSEIIASILPYAVGAVGIIAALVGVFMRGKQAERNERMADERETIEKAKEVRDESASLSDDSIRDRARQWVRGQRR